MDLIKKCHTTPPSRENEQSHASDTGQAWLCDLSD